MPSGENLTNRMYPQITQQTVSHTGGVQEAWEV